MSIQVGQVGAAGSISGLGLSYCDAAGVVDCGNNNGSLRWMTISPLGVTQTFGYDGLDRIASATESQTSGGAVVWSKSFDADAYGNWWATGNSGLPYNAQEPALQSAFDAATNRFADTNNYDGAGNRTLAAPFTLAYDGENRVGSASSALNGSTAYTYDGEGRRVLAVQSDRTYRLYVHDAAGELAAEYTNGAVAAGTQYVSVDHLGSTRVVTDESAGYGVQRFDYLPYGGDLGQMSLGNRTAGLGYGGEWAEGPVHGQGKGFGIGPRLLRGWECKEFCVNARPGV